MLSLPSKNVSWQGNGGQKSNEKVFFVFKTIGIGICATVQCTRKKIYILCTQFFWCKMSGEEKTIKHFFLEEITLT